VLTEQLLLIHLIAQQAGTVVVVDLAVKPDHALADTIHLP